KRDYRMTPSWTRADSAGEPAAAAAVAHVLRTWCSADQVAYRDEQGRGARFRVVSYREDFAYLWGIGPNPGAGFGGGARAADAAGTLVLVWDGLPPPRGPSTIDTGRYLTALDWVVALALALEADAAAGRPWSDLRVLILDLASRDWPSADAVRFFDQF